MTLKRRPQATPASFLPVKFFCNKADDRQTSAGQLKHAQIAPVMRREITHDAVKARSKEKAKTKKTP
jgi:hypothetical protein